MEAFGVIGSREAPPHVLAAAERIGEYLVTRCHRIDSGNAQGMDQAYAAGANKVRPDLVQLHLPWRTYESQAIHPDNKIVLGYADPNCEKKLAELCHYRWENLSQGVRRLMIRNAGIVTHTSRTIAYLNPKKRWGGGTAHGVAISKHLKHDVFLITDSFVFDEFEIWYASSEPT